MSLHFFDDDDKDIENIARRAVYKDFRSYVMDAMASESESSLSVDDTYLKQISPSNEQPIVRTSPSSPESPIVPAAQPLDANRVKKIKSSKLLVLLLLVPLGCVFLIPPAMQIVVTKNYNKDGSNNKNKKNSEQKTKSSDRRSILLENIDIPIFLDFPGTCNHVFLIALTRCLNLNSAPVELYVNNLYQNISSSYDFLTLNSTCGWHQPYMKPLKFFFMIENPILRLMTNYDDIKDTKSPRYDKKLSHLKSFSNYLDKSLANAKNHNIVTRSILCRIKKDLNENDFDYAKSFLLKNAYVGDFKDYNKAILLFQEKFNWKTENNFGTVSSCMDDYLKKATLKRAIPFDSYQYFTQKRLQDIYKSNFYDMNIYLDLIKNK